MDRGELAPDLARKYELLLSLLKQAGPGAVAFSGGVDSTLLLASAVTVLGPQVVAFHGGSVLQGEGEQEEARDVLATLGCQVQFFALTPLAWPEFVANPPDRCYRCKKRLYGLFGAALAKRGGGQLYDGTNADDLHGERPGLRAVRELGVSTPLAEAGLGKPEIRRLSRWLGLPTWAKHAASCLATRLPHGEPISAEALAAVRSAEAFLSSLGFSGCRVRLDRGRVFVELVSGWSAKLLQPQIKAQVQGYFSRHGFHKVYLDLAEREGVLV